MELGEILFLKSPALEQNHRQRIAEDQHRRGARGGGEVQWTRLLRHGDIQHDLRRLREGGVFIPRDGDDRQAEADDGWQHGQQLLRLPAVAEREHNIPVGNNAEVAVESIQGIQNDRRAPCAGERGGDFFADVAGFSDPEDDDLVPLLHGGLDKVHRSHKLAVQSGGCGFPLGKLDLENTAGQLEIIHSRIMQNHTRPRKGAG